MISHGGASLIDHSSGLTISGANALYARIDASNQPFTGSVGVSAINATMYVNALSGESWSIQAIGGAVSQAFSSGVTDPEFLTWSSGLLAFDNEFKCSRLKLTANTTTTNNGDIWNDTTQKGILTFVDGIKQSLVGTIFTQTADQTVTNTVTETTILGTGVGTKTLPASFFVAGKSIRIAVYGIYSTPALGATATIKVKYGSTVLATVATSSLLGGASGLEFRGEAVITCRTTGSSGTVVINGRVIYASGVAGQVAQDSLNNGGSAVTINTTTSNALDVTITWDTNTSTRIATSTGTTIEVLN